MSDRFRLVAIDLDGTLLDSSRNISSENRDAVAAAVDTGASVAIVTGRRLPSARRFADQLAIEPVVVANSGAIVADGPGRHIVRRCLLPRAVATDVVAIAMRAGIEPVVHDGPNGEGHLLLRESAKELPHVGRYLTQTKPPPIWVSSIELERDPVQIGFAGGLGGIRDFEKHLRGEIPRAAVSLIKTEYPADDLALLDVLASDANKASGLKFVSERAGVPIAQTLAIGDNWNDVDMLRAAGLGVVMANAVDELKAMGFAVTVSNDANGVARAIEKYVL